MLGREERVGRSDCGDFALEVLEVIVGVGGLAVFEEEGEAAAFGSVCEEDSVAAFFGHVDVCRDGVRVVFVLRCERDVEVAVGA